MNIATKETQINEEIRDREVRVIDSDGTQLGIMPIAEAMRLADEKNTDLVKIAPQAKPPVCKIMDYGKYRFEQAKRERKPKRTRELLRSKRFVCRSTLIRTILRQRLTKPSSSLKAVTELRFQSVSEAVKWLIPKTDLSP